MSAPTIGGSVTDAGCGDGGSITATISNDSGTNYSWDPDLGQTLTPMNLDPGMYTLTVVNVNSGCDAERTFEVGENVQPLQLSLSKVDALCNGDSGSIQLTISGGCGPYTVVWNDGTVMGQNPSVPAGTYSVTVTDTQGTVATGSVTVEEPAPLVLGTPMVTNSTGSDGSITVMVSGGTEPYSYAWTPTLPNSNSVSGLAPGNYTVVVTDDNGCTITSPVIPVEDNSSAITDITVTVSDILCFGDVNGAITVNMVGMDFPGTLVLSGAGSATQTISASSNFTFEDLGAGSYTVTFTDAAGVVVTDNAVISEPEEFAFDMTNEDIGCDNDSQCDGFIDIQTDGGTGLLSYMWGDTSIVGASADNLCAGTYPVVVTDANGCTLAESFVVDNCTPPNEPCYEFPKIITPNGDGRNDFFSANCLRDFPAELTVYDRWGRVVFNMLNYDGSWNGVDTQGDDLIEGGYMWLLDIDFPEGRRELMKGTVTLLRE